MRRLKKLLCILTYVSDAPVCFLLINAAPELAIISIDSCLLVTKSIIYIGFTGSTDVTPFLNNSRIKLIDLTDEAHKLGISSGNYADFSQKEFFVLVQLKWKLILATLEDSGARFVQYSDLDVLWISNPADAISSTYENNPEVCILIQDFTSNPGSPNLCMGYSVFKNNHATKVILLKLEELHQEMLLLNPFLGDDDVMSQYFRKENRLRILLLPQSTFPVGSLGLLLSGKTFYPGIRVPQPYIFHANYVVGTMRKIEYLLMVGRHFRFTFRRIDKMARLKYSITFRLRKLKFKLQIK